VVPDRREELVIEFAADGSVPRVERVLREVAGDIGKPGCQGEGHDHIPYFYRSVMGYHEQDN